MRWTGMELFSVINKSTVGPAAVSFRSSASDPGGFYSLTSDIREERGDRGERNVVWEKCGLSVWSDGTYTHTPGFFLHREHLGARLSRFPERL